MYVFKCIYFFHLICFNTFPTGQVGLGVASWPNNRAIKSQRNPIILRDLTQECRKNI